jgi:arsenate reductase (thioredoxin)
MEKALAPGMTISTLARRAGLSPSGVRWYEAVGILPRPVRRENGYREYTDADLSRLTLVLTLRRLGLKPVEAGHLAERCLQGGALDGELARTLEAQRRAIGRQRAELERLEVQLGDLETTVAAAIRAGGRRTTPTTKPISTLFVCNGNSARSQIAEALLQRLGGDEFDALSAGTRPRSVHPLAVRALAEIGIEWGAARAKSVDEMLHRSLDYVVTLSDSARESCPTLPGPHSSLHWRLDDPSEVEGSEEVRLEAFRATRTDLSLRLRPFIEIARRAAGHIPAIAGPEPRRLAAATKS